MNRFLIRIIPKTLFFKVSNTFWLLLLAIATAQYFLLSFYWREAVDTLMQRLNWGLADLLSSELVERVEGKEITAELISYELYRMEQLNPNVDLYIINTQGEIEWAVFDLGSPNFLGKTTVSVDAIDRFFRSPDFSQLPVYAENPLFREQKSVFSASRFQLAGKDKYLYVVLFGRRLHVLIDNVEIRYLTVGGSIVIALFLTFTMAMGFAAFFIVTRRFREIVHSVHQFSSGDMNARVAISGKDELATLAAEINSMADTAVKSLQEVKQLDGLRRKMVAMISHDLGSPLRATQVSLAQAERNLQSGELEALEKSLVAASKNTEALLAQVEELFELSKLETNEIPPEFESFSLLDVVTEELIPRFSPLAAQDEITICAEYDSTDTFAVLGDMSMIERALSNLMQNAIRYNVPNGTISVRLKREPGFVLVSVEDTGKGIPVEDLEVIFEPFGRSQLGKAHRESSGLGLAIVKQILRVHQQEVFVRSTPGVGTCFSFRLPEARDPIYCSQLKLRL